MSPKEGAWWISLFIMLPEEPGDRDKGSRKGLDQNLWYRMWTCGLLRDLPLGSSGRWGCILWDVCTSDAFSFRGDSALLWPSIYLFIYLFIYFILFYLWLCWVFVSVRGLSLVAASGGHSSSRCAGLSLSQPLLLRSTGSRRAGSVIVAHRPSCSAACGIFPDQGSNPCPLHWQADSQPLRHQGSPGLQFMTHGYRGHII